MSGAPEYELVGLLHSVSAPVRYGYGRQKQQILLLSDTPSPQMIPLEVHEPLMQELHRIPLQAKVRVRFAMEGRLWHPPQGSPRPILRLIVIEIERLLD
ncbi:MAG: hypothetical protein N3E49_07575 [Bacteroidia bacterium]|nr:hypothetical protein [Bacteroidia bacterium]